MNTLVIDTNIFVSELIKDGLIREILMNSDINFIFPEFGITEIYKYKADIINKAKINEKEFDILLLRLLRYIRLIPLELILNFRKDAVFIATALAFNCPIWIEDKHFKRQNKIKIFNTKEIKDLL